MPENTSTRPPELHYLGFDGAGSTGYIEAMEAAGGAQLLASELMPAKGPWRELVKLGFGEPVKTDDPLFVRTTLPPGWSRRTMDDPRGSYVLDQRGLPRVEVFYKAAFYDRKADCHLVDVGSHAATEQIYSDELAAPLPEGWELMSSRERRTYTQHLYAYLGQAHEHPGVYGDRVKRVRLLIGAVKDWRRRRRLARAGMAK